MFVFHSEQVFCRLLLKTRVRGVAIFHSVSVNKGHVHKVLRPKLWSFHYSPHHASFWVWVAPFTFLLSPWPKSLANHPLLFDRQAYQQGEVNF